MRVEVKMQMDIGPSEWNSEESAESVDTLMKQCVKQFMDCSVEQCEWCPQIECEGCSSFVVLSIKEIK